MKGLSAAFYKDWKLFLKNAGLLTLVLPFLLLALMRAGMSDLSSAQYIHPFTIAVRDEDGTIMSRSLTEQMKRVEFFGDVMVLTEEDTEEDALREGACAVFTIPADFFYDAYTNEQQPVKVTLSSTRRPEAAVFRMIFTSVMDIMREEQAVQSAVYGFCFPEPDAGVLDRMHADGSARLLENALRRNNAFARNTSATDIAGALIRRLCAAALSFLVLFEASAVLRSIPEERRRGVRSRFEAAGGSGAAFLLSRILLLGVILAPSCLALWIVLSAAGAAEPSSAAGYGLFCALFSAGICGMILGFLHISDDGTSASRYAGWYLLLSLIPGGTLIPSSALPQFLHPAVRFLPSGCAMYVLAALGRGTDAGGILWIMGPFLLLSLLFWLGTMPAALLREKRIRGGRERGTDSPRMQGDTRETLLGSRFAGMAFMKYRKMTGGIPGILSLAAVALCAGACVFGAFRGAGETVRIAVVDEERSIEAEDFIRLLGNMGNIEVLQEDRKESELLLLDGTVEGVLTIRPGFGDYVRGGSAVSERDDLHVLFYESAAASFSAQGMREIVSGQTMVLKIRNTAADWAGELLGRPLTLPEREQLEEQIRRSEETVMSRGSFYEIQWSEGKAAADPFIPQPEAFASLIILFAVLSASVWCGKRDNMSAEKRLLSFRGGTLLSYGTDFLALVLVGITSLAAYSIPWIGEHALPDAGLVCGTSLYLAVTAALALFFVRNLSGEGGADVLTSFLALAVCILGGCFLDLRDTVPVMKTVSGILPPGLMLYRGGRGIPVIAAEGILFLLAARPGRFRA